MEEFQNQIYKWYIILNRANRWYRHKFIRIPTTYLLRLQDTSRQRMVKDRIKKQVDRNTNNKHLQQMEIQFNKVETEIIKEALRIAVQLSSQTEITANFGKNTQPGALVIDAGRLVTKLSENNIDRSTLSSKIEALVPKEENKSNTPSTGKVFEGTFNNANVTIVRNDESEPYRASIRVDLMTRKYIDSSIIETANNSDEQNIAVASMLVNKINQLDNINLANIS